MPKDLPIELFHHVVESAYDAIVISTPGLDEPHPMIEWVNPAFERMTGWSRKEVVGQSPRILQGPKTSREFLDRLRDDLANGRPFQGEAVNYRKDGTEYCVEWKIAPLKDADGALRHWVAIQRDTTERHRITEELERRVQERTQELEGFLYTVSHDFRAPLRAIMSASMILIEDYGDKIDREGQDELRRQSAAAKKLGVLMDDLLRLSRLGRQEMKQENIDLSALAAEVAAEVRAHAPIAPEVTIAAGLSTVGDPMLLRLLIQNLLENAVKFAKKDNVPKIEIGVQGNAFYVKDEGIGFVPEKAEQIFGPFVRLHTEQEYPGSGVGLANVKRIVDRHEGRIWAEGRPGEGATFRFTLGR